MSDIEAEWSSFLTGSDVPDDWTPSHGDWTDSRREWEPENEMELLGLTGSDYVYEGPTVFEDVEDDAEGPDIVSVAMAVPIGEGSGGGGGVEGVPCVPLGVARVSGSSGGNGKKSVPVGGPRSGSGNGRSGVAVTRTRGGKGIPGGIKPDGVMILGGGAAAALAASQAPEPMPLYISTKSIITYFNTPIDIHRMFWNLEVHPYTTAAECVLKKEIKLTSNTPEEVEEIKRKIADIPYVKEHVITHLNAADGRTPFKDVRKIIVGLSKKDITACRIKQKGAFYNCLVMILRIQMDKEGSFREVHVKVFNTGKIEIPGIQTDATLQYILDKLVEYLQPLTDTPLSFQDTTQETVLINSNFNCRFYINREAMFSILRSKYRVQCCYDPCSYPGIRCKYTDEASGLVNISFMIFRTGSVLIVGKCDEAGIYRIYDYVKSILRIEFANIHQPMSESEQLAAPVKKKTIRKRKIYVEDDTPGIV